MSPYRWKITKDHLTKEGEESYAVGIEGPSDLDESITSNATQFALYDDDKNCYYEGMLYGDFDGHEPIYDFGMGYAGAVHCKIEGAWL